MNAGDVKMTPSRYRRVVVLLNQLDEYRRIAETAGVDGLAASISELLSDFESKKKAAILASGTRRPVQFDEFGRTYTKGARKESSARVWVIPVQTKPTESAPKEEVLSLPGSAPALSAFNKPSPVQVTTSSILINNLPLNEYLYVRHESLQHHIRST